MKAAPMILVVDDDVDIRETLADLLREEGYRVLSACNGLDAMQLLQKCEHPSMIILDMMMPVMDGAEFREAQLDSPALADIPVVVFSAHGDVRELTDRLHPAGVLRKPLRLEELLTVTDRVLHRRNVPAPRASISRPAVVGPD